MNLRIKTGQLPGDVSKQTKQAMLEGRHPEKKRSKTMKKVVRMSEKAVLKERMRKHVSEET